MLASSDTAEAASWLSGIVYTVAWSISFYPQLILNLRQRSTHGLTPDFPLLNVFGFACYTITNAAFLYSPTVREQYAARNPAAPEPTVRGNDLAFGIHALILCILTYSQFWPKLWGWKMLPGERGHAQKSTLGILWGSMFALASMVMLVLINRSNDDDSVFAWQWIDVIYTTSFVKILLTIFKYIPQVVANFRRKSTIGWSITQQLLDFTGGVFSLLQLIIDSAAQDDWSGLVGNPLKLGLANVSMLFDIVFIAQHYVLYGPVEERNVMEVRQAPSEEEALLSPSG